MEVSITGTHRDAAAAAHTCRLNSWIRTLVSTGVHTFMLPACECEDIIYTKMRRCRHTNTSTETYYHILHAVFVSSTLLLPVCFSNLTVYISGSKTVSITPTRAISMREKKIKCLMKAKTGS